MSKDTKLAIFSGILTGAIWSVILIRLGTFTSLGWHYQVFVLMIIVPIVFVVGLALGRWLGRQWAFFYPFSKFAAVGFLNSGVDIGFFNFLIYLTNIQTGAEIILFKTCSFTLALLNSYVWNKYWSFNSAQTKRRGREFAEYVVVTVVGYLINVGVTSAIINFIKPFDGVTQLSWDTLAAVAATVLNLLWNFLGYHLIVFKDKPQVKS